MKRFFLGFTALALVTSLALVLTGCGGKDKNNTDGDEGPPVVGGKGGKKDTKKGSGTAANWKAIEGKGTATLKGKITVKGGNVAGVVAALTKKIQDDISKNADKDYCMKGSEKEVAEQSYRVGTNNQVGNVVVWIAPTEKGQYFPISDKQLKEAKDHPVVIGQPHCAFLPHVFAAFPKYRDPAKSKDLVPTGQAFTVENNAEKGHNTKITGSAKNETDTGTLPPGIKKPLELEPDTKPLELKCNIHGWMSGFGWVFDHPYFAISKSDTSPDAVKLDDVSFGTFEIKDVPAGAKVKLYAWHERAGKFVDEEIELKDGANERNFEIEVKE